MPAKASYEPTLEEIAAATARIRAGWQEGKFIRRKTYQTDEDESANDQSAEDEKVARSEILGDG